MHVQSHPRAALRKCRHAPTCFSADPPLPAPSLVGSALLVVPPPTRPDMRPTARPRTRKSCGTIGAVPTGKVSGWSQPFDDFVARPSGRLSGLCFVHVARGEFERSALAAAHVFVAGHGAAPCIFFSYCRGPCRPNEADRALRRRPSGGGGGKRPAPL